jgi:transcriptional regulator with XRE-family HTH domain
MPRKNRKAPVGSLLKKPLSPNFIREWRKYRNDMTQEVLAERVAEWLGTSFTPATLSRIENRKSPYNQRQLDALADALNCGPADLIIRNPLDTEAPWSIWERLNAPQRRQAIRLLKALADDEAA